MSYYWPALPAVSTDAVKEYLKLQTTDDAELVPVVAAVNDLLVSWFGEHNNETPWPDRFVTGGVMLAARIYRRRNSPAGVESFGEMGPVYIQRNDPDLALLLGLGAYKRPQIG